MLCALNIILREKAPNLHYIFTDLTRNHKTTTTTRTARIPKYPWRRGVRASRFLRILLVTAVSFQINDCSSVYWAEPQVNEVAGEGE
jgi:hypothetical protein